MKIIIKLKKIKPKLKRNAKNKKALKIKKKTNKKN